MSRRTQIYVMVALLAVLALVLRYNRTRAPELTIFSADEKFRPLEVENPSLRLDLLERIHKLEYAGTHRNIFSASAPPPPPPVVTKNGPQIPPPPPPLEVPAKFFGYVCNPNTGKRRAFFISGEEVYIVSEGETLHSRFRLLRIGNTTAEFEEIGSGRRATLTLEERPPTG